MPEDRFLASKFMECLPADLFSPFNSVATFLPSRSNTSSVTFPLCGKAKPIVVLGLNGCG